MARHSVEAIVIGGSAGAIDALTAILPELPADFPIPIAMVIHVAPGRPSGLVDLFQARCSLTVREAEDKAAFAPGTIYIAPPDYHLLVERRRCFSLSVDDPVHFSRPAVDVLFESAADAYGPGLLGVLLSGANEDGARGLSAIGRAGGLTVAQAPQTAASSTMPQAAIAAFDVDHVLPVNEIGPFLARLGADRLLLGEAT